MNWAAILRRFPRFVLVVSIFVFSTILFAFWWFTRSPAKVAAKQAVEVKQAEDFREKAKKVENRIHYLFLADEDLYDVETGELVFSKWLRGYTPEQVFYDEKNRKVIGRFPEGYRRFGLDGSLEKELVMKRPPVFSKDRKKAWFVRDKDIWVTEPDWETWEFKSERKLTSIGQFFDNHFADSVLLATDKTLVVRIANKQARLDLATGDVKSTQYPLDGLFKRRSPNQQFLVGVEQGKFYCLDVDTDEAKTVDVGRGAMNDYQWLDNDICVMIAGGTKVVAYHRLKHTLTEIATLPFHADKIGEPSPTGRYVFCGGRLGRVVVDIKKGQAESIAEAHAIFWKDESTYIFTREPLNLKTSGTWLRAIGEPEVKVNDQPILNMMNGTDIGMVERSRGKLLCTEGSVYHILPQNTKFRRVAALRRPVNKILVVRLWNPRLEPNVSPEGGEDLRMLPEN